jgi:ribosome-binding factor A
MTYSKASRTAEPSCSTALVAEEMDEQLPGDMRKTIHDKKLKFFTVDAIKIAQDVGWAAAST